MPYYVHSDPNADDGYWRDDDEQRECARAERCAEPRKVTVDGKTVWLGALTPRAFCDGCRDTVERAIGDLPALYARVYDEIGEASKAGGPKVSISKSAPVPINLAVDELLRDMTAVLVSWHERVAAVARLCDPDGTVTTACKVLTAHVDALLALPEEPMMRSVSLREAARLPRGTLGLVHRSAEYADVIQHMGGAKAGLEILQLHYRCRHLLGETNKAARRLNGVTCEGLESDGVRDGGCGFAELRERLDAEGQFAGARCRECGLEYDADQYRALTTGQGKAVKDTGVKVRSLVHYGPLDDEVTRRA